MTLPWGACGQVGLSLHSHLSTRDRHLSLSDLQLAFLDSNALLPGVIRLKDSVQLLERQPFCLHEVEVHKCCFKRVPEDEEDVEPVPDLEMFSMIIMAMSLVYSRWKAQWVRQMCLRTRPRRW